MVGNINIPVNSVKDVIEQEKAKPGNFQIGVSTPTSQVIVGLLNHDGRHQFQHGALQGGTTQITGLLAGDIPLGMESANVSLPLWRDGKIKILGLIERTAAVARAGNPDRSRRRIRASISASGRASWRRPARRRRSSRSLHASLAKVLAMPDVREKLLDAGIEPAISKSPEEFAAFIRSQADTRAKVIKAVGMKLD